MSKLGSRNAFENGFVGEEDMEPAMFDWQLLQTFPNAVLESVDFFWVVDGPNLDCHVAFQFSKPCEHLQHFPCLRVKTSKLPSMNSGRDEQPTVPAKFWC